MGGREYIDGDEKDGNKRKRLSYKRNRKLNMI